MFADADDHPGVVADHLLEHLAGRLAKADSDCSTTMLWPMFNSLRCGTAKLHGRFRS